MTEKTLFIAMFGAFIWGFRHAVDWDHIAAITDITSTQNSTRSGIYLGTLYALGHSAVVGGLGFLAIAFGSSIPGWLDVSMGYLVGLTILMLGIYVGISLFRMRKGAETDLRMRSRWWVLLTGLSYGYEWIRAFITRQPMRKPKKFFETYYPKTAVLIGAIHGIGAETPTQVLLFVGAAGFAGTSGAILLLFSFIAGMLLMNTTMILVSSLGYFGAEKNRALYYGTFYSTAAFSVVVGILFITGMDSYLPVIFPAG